MIGADELLGKKSAVDQSGNLRNQPIEGVIFRPTRPVPHEDGHVTEVARASWEMLRAPVVQVHITTTFPGRARAWGLHQLGTQSNRADERSMTAEKTRVLPPQNHQTDRCIDNTSSPAAHEKWNHWRRNPSGHRSKPRRAFPNDAVTKCRRGRDRRCAFHAPPQSPHCSEPIASGSARKDPPNEPLDRTLVLITSLESSLQPSPTTMISNSACV